MGINEQTAGEPSVRDILAQLGSVGPAEQRRSPIGVPGDYAARVEREYGNPNGEIGGGVGTRTVSIAPRYFDGDEWRPANLPPDRIAEQQRALVDAGLLAEKDYHAEIGSWGQRSVDAYARLLQNANATGLSADEALGTLQSAAAARGKAPDPSRVPEPLVIRLTNPDDIKALANDVSVRRLGRRLSDDQLERHVAAWQSSEREAQERQYQMTGSGLPGGTGGTIIDPVGARGLDEQIRRENTPEAQGYDAVGRMRQFEQLLRGGS